VSGEGTGGRISPEDTGQVPAWRVQAGDRLLIGGLPAEVTDVRAGFWWFPSGHRDYGVAIGWKAGSSSGLLFRKAGDILPRVTTTTPEEGTP